MNKDEKFSKLADMLQKYIPLMQETLDQMRKINDIKYFDLDAVQIMLGDWLAEVFSWGYKDSFLMCKETLDVIKDADAKRMN